MALSALRAGDPKSDTLAAKLRLTAAALGCRTRKELCARFRAVNPATAFDLERSHKWLQGVAAPRTPAVYDDWARVIGTARGGGWIAGCEPDALAEELCALFALERGDLWARAQATARAPVPIVADRCFGCFVAYSWAMAPRHAGDLIRACLTLAPGRGARAKATYVEGAPASEALEGVAVETGRMLSVDLECPSDPAVGRFFMTLLHTGRPTDVMCGEFLGAPVLAAAQQVAVSRIAALRIDPRSAPIAGGEGCYVAAEPGALTVYLARVGFAAAVASPLSAALLAFLERPRPGLAHTTTESCVALVDAVAAAAPTPKPSSTPEPTRQDVLRVMR